MVGLSKSGPFWATHAQRDVVLDSGFCVLSALAELQKVAVFEGALINKCQFWPALVPGDVIDSYFRNLDVGRVNAVAGQLAGVKYHIWAMKDAGDVTKVWGRLLV